MNDILKRNCQVSYFYLKDHQGNNRVVLDKNDSIMQVNHYYPFGALFGESKDGGLQKYKYNGKELERMYELDLYDYGARWMYPVLGRFTTPDPLCEKYYSISPYTYCENNPIKRIDPTGMKIDAMGIDDFMDDPSTDVEFNSTDSTYIVLDAKADGDLNIYLDENQKRTGEIIGQSLTEYSFINDNGKAAKGAIINPRDRSGIDFLSNQIIGGNPNLLHYMLNATGGEAYDFKRMGSGMNATEAQLYRGMPFNNDGTYASARDIGNRGAGYIAGKSGLSWGMARIGFDGLESYQNNNISVSKLKWYIEGQSTLDAERVGYESGSRVFQVKLLNVLIKFMH